MQIIIIIIIIALILVSAEIMQEQEKIWQKTLANESATSQPVQLHSPEVNPQLMHDLQVIVSRLASKADRLIQNFTTNMAENWMQIRCKFDGGKYVNRSQSGSFEHRCSGAALQKNLGKTWGPTMWETMVGGTANEVYINAAETSAKRAVKDLERKSTKKSKENRRRNKYSKVDNSIAARKAYSRHDNITEPDDITDDISPENLDELKQSFYMTQVFVVTNEDIEECTREQGNCDLWKEERMKRVTASHVGGILKMRKATKRSGKVKEILYSTFTGSKATRYGTLMEDVARQEYVNKQHENGHPGLKTRESGLVISMDNPWLAASPDGKVEDPNSPNPQGLMEIKNPYSARMLTIREACENKSFFLEKVNQDMYSLKRKHNYFFQIQCQMYCCNVDWCDFIVRTEKDIHIERITRMKSWWEEQIPMLRKFYFDALLPELASPRQGMGGIREPTA